MDNITNLSDSESLSDQEDGKETKPKVGVLGLNLQSATMTSRNTGDNVASSSGSNLRSNFIGMGFSPSLVDKVIAKNGADSADLLLEALLEHSDLQKAGSESSDSLESLFNDDDGASRSLKEEPDAHNEVYDDKRASLLMMNFTVDDVAFAIDKLGEGALLNDLVDFIIAAQIARKPESDTDDTIPGDEGKNEDANTETLFGTMDKTLQLLEMGFSECEISAAIEKFGSEVPLSELAESIVAGQITGTSVKKEEDWSDSYNMGHSNASIGYSPLGRKKDNILKRHFLDTSMVKTEYCSQDAIFQFRTAQIDEFRKGKKPKEEYVDDSSSYLGPARAFSHKPPRQTSNQFDRFGMSKLSKPSKCKSVDKMVSKPPYFFYGNVVNVSHDSWAKVSQFLYAIEPEFVNTQFFSALSRKEGYIHNLPTENRFHILPKPPMTIEAAIPQTKKWWPSWDSRKQLSCISSETIGISQLCDRLGRILIESRGLLSAEQQTDILHHCRTLNLVWVGPQKLGTIEPEHLERILGYPSHHTRAPEFSLTVRFQTLKNCFQTDTLGYHISVLKSIYPGGLTLLSLYSGIGGAEISLHRLGIKLKGVVSVETSEVNRKILKRWWDESGQTGELVQMEGIQRLTSQKIQSLIDKFGGFDFVICQNPCTYSTRSSKLAVDDETFMGLDFSMFYEFVRVLQRVRSTMERKS